MPPEQAVKDAATRKAEQQQKLKELSQRHKKRFLTTRTYRPPV